MFCQHEKKSTTFRVVPQRLVISAFRESSYFQFSFWLLTEPAPRKKNVSVDFHLARACARVTRCPCERRWRWQTCLATALTFFISLQRIRWFFFCSTFPEYSYTCVGCDFFLSCLRFLRIARIFAAAYKYMCVVFFFTFLFLFSFRYWSVQFDVCLCLYLLFSLFSYDFILYFHFPFFLSILLLYFPSYIRAYFCLIDEHVARSFVRSFIQLVACTLTCCMFPVCEYWFSISNKNDCISLYFNHFHSSETFHMSLWEPWSPLHPVHTAWSRLLR